MVQLNASGSGEFTRLYKTIKKANATTLSFYFLFFL